MSTLTTAPATIPITFQPWLWWWLLLSCVAVLYDSGYVLLRPWTQEGGILYPLWAPYKLYGDVDLIYGDARYASGDRFCEAQSICNLVEVGLQLLALHLLSKRQAPAAAMVAITTQGFTFWKTILYWLYDIAGGFSSTGHNSLWRLVLVYLIPNGLWIVFPLLVTVELSAQVLRALNAFYGIATPHAKEA